VTVPNVIGQTQSEATSSLTGQGLAVTTVTTSDCPPKDDGDVVSENPVPGSSVPAGSTIVISPCDSASSMIDVLDVVGQTQSQATSTLQGQGLVVTTTSVSECGASDDGNVVSQNPPAGTAVETGASEVIGICIGTG
jgi:serine/threonine-protein kinase